MNTVETPIVEKMEIPKDGIIEELNRKLEEQNQKLKDADETLKQKEMSERNLLEGLRYRDGVIDGLKFALRCNGISGGEVM